MTRSILPRIFQTALPSSRRAPWKAAAITVGLALAATSATAAIVATGLSAIQIAPPASVALGQLQSNVDMFAFNERPCFWLNFNLPTDQGFIPAFTKMSSHLLHVDAVTNTMLDGRVRFDNVILGVISTTAGLDGSDAACGAPGTAYPTGMEPSRGLEPGQADAYQIIAGGFAIQARMDLPPFVSFTDQIRVLTRCECVGTVCGAD